MFGCYIYIGDYCIKFFEVQVGDQIIKVLVSE